MTLVSMFVGYKPALSMVLAQCIYAGVSLFTRAAILEGMNPRIFVVYRQAIATLFLSPIAYFSRWGNPNNPSLKWRSVSLIFLAALVGLSGNQITYFEGLSLTSSSIAIASTNLIPALTFLMAFVAGLEKMNFRSLRSIAKIVGTAICVGGAIIMALVKGAALLESAFGLGSESWLLGCLLLFVSNCCWSFWLILQVPISECYPDHLSSTALICFFSTIQSGIIAWSLDRELADWIVHPNIELVSCIYSGVLGSAGAYFLQAWCISLKGPLFAAMFYPLGTVLVTILAPVFLDETIYVGSLIGAATLIIGLYIVLWGKAGDTGDVPNEGNEHQDDHTSSRNDLEEHFLT